MNQAQFDKLTKAEMSSLLESEFGFAFDEGVFYRNLSSKVRHEVIFDYDARSKKTFRVMVGLNSSLIYGETPASQAGIFCVRYLNAVGFSERPVNFPCFDEAAAKESLKNIRDALVDAVLPWFSAIVSIRDLASCVEEQYPFVKGKLYCLAGDGVQGEIFLSRHLSYLVQQPHSEELERALDETRQLLRLCVN